MTEERQLDIIECARRLANTNDGMKLIKYAKEDYLIKSPIDKKGVEMTYFNIGIQHLVKIVLKLIEDHDRYERLILVSKNEKKVR